MNTHDNTYLELLRHILAKGKVKGDRTGTGTTGVHGYQMRFDLSDGFPLLTTKKIPFRLIVSELLWFIKGDTNLRTLLLSNNHIWDEWPYKWYLKKEGLPIPKPTSAEWTEGMRLLPTELLLMSHLPHNMETWDQFTAISGETGLIQMVASSTSSN